MGDPCAGWKIERLTPRLHRLHGSAVAFVEAYPKAASPKVLPCYTAPNG